AADTLMALEGGASSGPDKEGATYKICTVMGRKPNATVKAGHILITWAGAEGANPAITRSKEEAETRAKELVTEARQEDVLFTTLARDNSDGPSAARGGDLGYFQEGVMADAFNDFCFGNPTGTIGLVETQFG